ncbi:MAG: hypothetical protein RLZZ297_444 [Chloroflexota bacterium]
MREHLETILNDCRTQYPDVLLTELRTLSARPGLDNPHAIARIPLADIWLRVCGNSRPHLTHLAATLARGEPALVSGWADARRDAALYGVLQSVQTGSDSRGLLIVADDYAAHAAYQRLMAWCAEYPAGSAPTISICTAPGDTDDDASLVIATAAVLHTVLLPGYAAVWERLWSRLAVIGLWELHEYGGVGLAHLRWLLRRCERVRLFHRASAPVVIASATPAQNATAVVSTICGRAATLTTVDDVPTPAVRSAHLRAGAAAPQVVGLLSTRLVGAGYRVHVVCHAVSLAVYRAVGLGGATCSDRVQPADVVICVADATERWVPQVAAASGAQAVIAVSDAGYGAQLAAAFPLADEPVWPIATDNAYIDTVHLHAAAAEIPLVTREVAGWGQTALVDRMRAHAHLRIIAGDVSVPGDAALSFDFDLRHAVGAAAAVTCNPGEDPVAVDAAAYERWYFPGMAAPPWQSGGVVTQRDSAAGTAVVAATPNVGGIVPLRLCRVQFAAGETPAAAGCDRVAVEEHCVGVLQWDVEHATAHRTVLDTAQQESAAWYAPAWWWHIGSAAAEHEPWLGWSVVAALSAVYPQAVVAVVPCYDAASGRLYLVDTQPGGAGVVAADAPGLVSALRAAQAWVAQQGHTEVAAAVAAADATWIAAATAPTARVPFSPAPPVPLADETPADETPADETPADETPADETPADETPADETPADETPAVETPAVETPADETPAVETPAVETPADDAPADDAPADEPRTDDAAAYMARLLDAAPQRAAGATVLRDWWLRLGAWWQAQTGHPGRAYVVGDAVSVLPYGEGVVVAVESVGEELRLVVATRAYGDVRVDPARDLVVPIDPAEPVDL